MSQKTANKTLAQKFTVISRTFESCTPDEKTRLLKMLAESFVVAPPAMATSSEATMAEAK